MAQAAFINITSSLDASPFPSVDQSIKVLPSTFPLVQGLQMLAECIQAIYAPPPRLSTDVSWSLAIFQILDSECIL